jgi:hypothetical protein
MALVGLVFYPALDKLQCGSPPWSRRSAPTHWVRLAPGLVPTAIRFVRWGTRTSHAERTIRLELGEAQVLCGEMSAGRATLRQLARDSVAGRPCTVRCSPEYPVKADGPTCC